MNSVITVAKMIPKLIEIAVGITNWACELFSNRIGINPAAVVNDVKMIACSVLFNRDLGEVEDEFLDQFDDDLPTT